MQNIRLLTILPILFFQNVLFDPDLLINGKPSRIESSFKVGEKLRFSLSGYSANYFDSISLSVNSKCLPCRKNHTFLWNTKNKRLGRYTIKLALYKNGTLLTSLTRHITLLSDYNPSILKVKLVSTYPHDTSAFTQGLIYQNGFLYEGTGIQGKSSLRKIELTSGKILAKYDINSEYFGEGITAFQNKIYQLTWKNNICIIYELNCLKFLGEFHYPIDGWGITHNNQALLASNGTNNIFMLNPSTLKIEDSIGIYDTKGPIKRINELEVINGKIYANIWNTDTIIQFCTKTGKLLSIIDLTQLSKKKNPEITQRGELNGIAYDRKKRRLFITGKKWPYLYEVKVTK